jgi:hypothetical protein
MRKADYDQRYVSFDYFPKDFILEQWSEGKTITSFNYESGKWYFVFSKLGKYSRESYSLKYDFPEDWIYEKRQDGYNCTSITFGDKKWIVVMSKPENSEDRLTFESVKKGSINDITEFIEYKWGYGYFITHVAFGNGEWVVVMAKNTGYRHQVYRYQSAFPEEWIDKYYKQEYRITGLTYSGKTWFVVMSKIPNPPGEICFYNENTPSDFLQKYWDKGYRVVLLKNSLPLE